MESVPGGWQDKAQEVSSYFFLFEPSPSSPRMVLENGFREGRERSRKRVQRKVVTDIERNEKQSGLWQSFPVVRACLGPHVSKDKSYSRMMAL